MFCSHARKILRRMRVMLIAQLIRFTKRQLVFHVYVPLYWYVLLYGLMSNSAHSFDAQRWRYIFVFVHTVDNALFRIVFIELGAVQTARGFSDRDGSAVVQSGQVEILVS